jgi:hypothetical protein
MTRGTVVLLSAALLATIFCGGCNEQFTKQRYETIYIGQSQMEVEKILGNPEARFSDSWTYLHEEPFYKAVIQFRDGRVSDKAWYDEKEMGVHPDTKGPSPSKDKVTVHTDAVP